MISENFLNTMERDNLGKGEGKWGKKGQFWAIWHSWIEVFLEEVLGLFANEGTTFMLNLSS